ncbi:hypothetical protein AB0F03_29770 [Streptomyces sp. NPDC028722]
MSSAKEKNSRWSRVLDVATQVMANAAGAVLAQVVIVWLGL